MIICHSRRFVLIRPRKVASSSVQGAFLPFLAKGDRVMRLDPRELGLAGPIEATIGYERSRWPLVLRQHSSLSRLVWVMGRQILDYRIITLARNPWDKVVSEFFYDMRAANLQQRSVVEQRSEFEKWLRANAYLSPLRRLAYRIEGSDRRSRFEQSALCVHAGRFRADHVIFYEDLEGGVEAVGKALGLDLRLPERKAKAGIRSEASRDWRSFYSEASQTLVADCCRTDILRFGYDFAGGRQPSFRAEG